MKALILLLLIASPVMAQQRTDDSDLSGRPTPSSVPLLKTEGAVQGGVRVFSAQDMGGSRIGILPTTPAVVTGRLVLVDPKGRELPGRLVKVMLAGPGAAAETLTDANGDFTLQVPASASGKTSVRFRLENNFWSITDPDSGKPYEWEAASVNLPAQRPVPVGTFRLDPATANGKIGYIHLQLLEAVALFEAEGIGMKWWDKRLTVNYPGDADYFSPWGFTLNLTHPEAWDVNLHEFGHAVMAAGMNAHGGGGQHKIDECYNEGLAWSEGWATFFGAAVHLSRDDEDAKFEFLVPRRAPIRIENVPADVCKGDKSEWRVSAGLWDLYDTHVDGQDRSGLSFARIWNSLFKKSMGSFNEAFQLIAVGMKADELAQSRVTLDQNTLSSTTAPSARRWWWPFPGTGGGKAVQQLAAPDFDGSRR